MSVAASGIGAAAQFGSDMISPWISGAASLYYGNQAADHALSNSKRMADYNAQISKELALFNYDLSLQANEENKVLSRFYAHNTPSWFREGLVQAGYNPILAVNGASGNIPNAMMSAPAASNVGGHQSPSMSSLQARLNAMDVVQKMSMIEQTEAQTDFIKKRTAGEGWQVKTLSRSEALGLGAHICHTLGFNFNDHSQTTFLVAYNPITGELRNLGDTKSGLGTTGEAHSADGVVDVSVDDRPTVRHHYNSSSEHPIFSEMIRDTPRSPLR